VLLLLLILCLMVAAHDRPQHSIQPALWRPQSRLCQAPARHSQLAHTQLPRQLQHAACQHPQLLLLLLLLLLVAASRRTRSSERGFQPAECCCRRRERLWCRMPRALRHHRRQCAAQQLHALLLLLLLLVVVWALCCCCLLPSCWLHEPAAGPRRDRKLAGA
jgi:hypothetical protein